MALAVRLSHFVLVVGINKAPWTAVHLAVCAGAGSADASHSATRSAVEIGLRRLLCMENHERKCC